MTGRPCSRRACRAASPPRSPRDQDLALFRLLEPGDEPKRRGLPATGGPEQREELAVRTDRSMLSTATTSSKRFVTPRARRRSSGLCHLTSVSSCRGTPRVATASSGGARPGPTGGLRQAPRRRARPAPRSTERFRLGSRSFRRPPAASVSHLDQVHGDRFRRLDVRLRLVAVGERQELLCQPRSQAEPACLFERRIGGGKRRELGMKRVDPLRLADRLGKARPASPEQGSTSWTRPPRRSSAASGARREACARSRAPGTDVPPRPGRA